MTTRSVQNYSVKSLKLFNSNFNWNYLTNDIVIGVRQNGFDLFLETSFQFVIFSVIFSDVI